MMYDIRMGLYLSFSKQQMLHELVHVSRILEDSPIFGSYNSQTVSLVGVHSLRTLSLLPLHTEHFLQRSVFDVTLEKYPVSQISHFVSRK